MRRGAPRSVRAARPRRGFTMVELLVALAVAGLVVLAAYGVVGFATDASRRLRDGRREALSVVNSRATLAGWLRGATVLDGAVPFVAVRRGSSERPLDEVTFAVEDGGPQHPGPHRIRLWVNREPTRARGLVGELTPVRNGAFAAAETLSVVPGEAVGVRLRYRTRVQQREVWVSEWSSAKLIPDAVWVEVVDAAGATFGRATREGRVPALASLPLRVQLDAGAP